MFRNLTILALGLTLCLGCKNSKNPDLPDNAINSSVIENPATASSKTSKVNVPVFKFEKEIHDFGTIVAGEKIAFAFRFKNTGNGDLVIRSAQGSCGCTVPEFPKEPVKPGEDGIINVTFDSEGRVGHQEKTVTVISNTIPNTIMLTITGEVKEVEE